MADASQADPLATLVDIPLPAPVGLWPQTWPALIATAVLILGAIALAWWAIRHARANRYRKAALAELARISHTDAPIAALAVLVRETAFAAFARDKIAALSGPAWLAFLDRSYGGNGFSHGPGRALIEAPYQPAQAANINVAPVAELVRHWIRTHRHD